MVLDEAKLLEVFYYFVKESQFLMLWQVIKVEETLLERLVVVQVFVNLHNWRLLGRFELC